MQVNNVVTWNRMVLVSSLLAGLEIDFFRILISVIHKRAFKTSTIYPFACRIPQLCKDARVPVWHCDTLHNPLRTVDIVLIGYDANVVAPRRGTKIEESPLGENLVDTVELA